MSLSARIILVLTCVGLLSGGFLATVGLLTKERIALNREKEIEEAILAVVPGASSSQKLYEGEGLTIYAGKDASGVLRGYAIHASGVGFQDKIVLMFGTNPALTKIRKLAVLEQKETPGLGAKITDEESFLRYWEEKDCTTELKLRKPAASSPQELSPSEVNTITGATISSEAVLKTVNLSLKLLKGLQLERELLGEEKDEE